MVIHRKIIVELSDPESNVGDSDGEAAVGGIVKEDVALQS